MVEMPTVEECVNHCAHKDQTFYVMESRVEKGIRDCYDFIQTKINQNKPQCKDKKASELFW